MTGVLHVCRGCKHADLAKRRQGLPGGPELEAALQALAPGLGLVIEPYECLGRCALGGRLSLTGPGRWSWLVEGIDPALDLPVLEAFVRAWQEAPDGFVPKDRRPQGLRKRLLGRLPPSTEPARKEEPR